MVARGWALMLVAVALGGCVDADGGKEPVTVTSPDDFSYLENAAPDQQAHLHDYWGGSDRLLISDDTYPCGGNLLSDPVICDYRPDTSIPLGTGRVEVTIAWTEDTDNVSHYDATELWVKTAAHQESTWVADVDAGAPIVFEVNNTDNDLPHQRLSAWEFDLYVFGDRDAPYPLTTKRFYADVHIEITAYRTLDIPLFPGHPDAWNGNDDLPLVTAYRYPEGSGDEIRTPAGSTVADDRRIRPDPGLMVPSDASHIQVVLDLDLAEGSDTVQLRYHGAADREWIDAQLVKETAARKIYQIDVSGDGDSPYAENSMWEFYTVFDNSGSDPVGGDYFHGNYHVTATVHRQ